MGISDTEAQEAEALEGMNSPDNQPARADGCARPAQQIGATHFCQECGCEVYPIDACKCRVRPVKDNQPAPGEGGVEPPKGFISAPSLEELQPTEAEKARFAQLFAWMEASKHSAIRLGPPPPIECANCQSLKHQLDAARAERTEIANIIAGFAQNADIHSDADLTMLKSIEAHYNELRQKLAECERERGKWYNMYQTVYRERQEAEEHVARLKTRNLLNGIKNICEVCGGHKANDICVECTQQERDRLRAENAGLREALGPMLKRLGGRESHSHAFPDDGQAGITWGQLRAAQRALQGGGGVE